MNDSKRDLFPLQNMALVSATNFIALNHYLIFVILVKKDNVM